MKDNDLKFLETGIYNFKSNLSRYIALLERRDYRGIIIKRHKKPIGVFFLYDDLKE